MTRHRVLIITGSGDPARDSFRRTGESIATAARGAGTLDCEIRPVRLPPVKYRPLPGLIRHYPDPLEPGLAGRFDVAHAVGPGFASTAAATGLPTVVTHHDLSPLTVEREPFPSPWRLLHARSLAPLYRYRWRLRFARHLAEMRASATLIACITSVVRDELVRWWPELAQRTVVVPNIVDSAIAPPRDPEPWLEARGLVLPMGPRIASLGRNGQRKNISWLLEVLGQPALRGTTLVRMGDPLQPLQAARARELGVRVADLGPVDEATKVHVLAACQALAQPSLYEGFGIPVIEAMAVGTPVVTTDGGALPEVVGNAGIVVPGSSEPQAPYGPFADALSAVLNQPGLRAELATKGLSRAAEFRPDRVLRQWVDVYADAARRGPLARARR